MLHVIEVAAVSGKIQGCICFRVFTIAVGKFADEMGFISSFRPGFTQVHANGPG